MVNQGQVISFDMHELPSLVAAMSTQWTVTQTASEQSEVTINADYELKGGLLGKVGRKAWSLVE
jgi:ribosome-associated toxin RatA of RatAB toxin-antitoxin module